MSFASMHNDYLDPDRYFQDEPPCEKCIHDDLENERCKLDKECNFEEIASQIEQMMTSYQERKAKWIADETKKSEESK